MSTSTRWQLAFPLIGLSLLLLVPALFGTWAWWSEYGIAYRALSIAICLIMTATVGVAVSIGIKPIRDVPWLRIGLVALGILLACGIAALREQV